jgi:hypothetical protein
VTERRPVVVEIGTGGQEPAPRPGFGDALLVGTELDPALLVAGPRPVLAADGRDLPFAARSVDLLVARNVFGDVGLGFGFEQVTGFDPPGYAAHVRELVQRGARPELEALRDKVRVMVAGVDATKQAMLRDAARVLRADGQVLVVETLTPDFARQWLEERAGGRIKHDAALSAGGVEFTCRAITQHNRRRRYCTASELADPALQVWTLTPIAGATRAARRR